MFFQGRTLMNVLGSAGIEREMNQKKVLVYIVTIIYNTHGEVNCLHHGMQHCCTLDKTDTWSSD